MKCRLVLVLIASAVVLSSLVSAQTYQGRILGSVTDPSGAVVSGAKVTITNTATGISRTLTTNASGDYNAPISSPARTQ